MNRTEATGGAVRIDPQELLGHFLQVMAFALAVSAILYILKPEKPYEVELVYSLSIAILNWLIIDLGRFALLPDPQTRWPKGWRWIFLVSCGILGGGLGGTQLGDMWFGWSSWDQSPAALRNTWVITLVAGIAASYYFYSRGRSSYLLARFTEAERHAAEARRQAAEAQLKLLQAQLDPHMLFNTLANLRVLIGFDPEAAQSMLDRMIAFLRATLSASRSTAHPLQAEFDRLRDYLELMAIRMGPRLRYTLDLPDELCGLPVPTLLLQPLVENSIKHGLEPKVQGGEITVRARRTPAPDGSPGSWLMLEVGDTGIGIGPAGDNSLPSPGTTASASHAGHGGFGLAQVRERLATAYGPAATARLTRNDAGGASATLHFPDTPPP